MTKSGISIPTNVAKGAAAIALCGGGAYAIGDGISKINMLTKSKEDFGTKFIKGVGAALEILGGILAEGGAMKLAHEAISENSGSIDLVDAGKCIASGVHAPLGSDIGQCIEHNATMTLIGDSDFA